MCSHSEPPMLLLFAISYFVLVITAELSVVTSPYSLFHENNPTFYKYNTYSPPKKWEPLKAASVAEGTCFQPQLASIINPLWFLSRRAYYIPVASQYSFRNYAEVFLGRPVNSTEELERMCLRVVISGLRARTYGFHKRVDQSCKLTSNFLLTFNPGQLKCTVDNTSPGTLTSLFADYWDNVVLTDNETFMVFVRCVNGVRDYKVLSIFPGLHPYVLEQVKRKITSLGFDPKLLQFLPCKLDVNHAINSNGKLKLNSTLLYQNY